MYMISICTFKEVYAFAKSNQMAGLNCFFQKQQSIYTVLNDQTVGGLTVYYVDVFCSPSGSPPVQYHIAGWHTGTEHTVMGHSLECDTF